MGTIESSIDAPPPGSAHAIGLPTCPPLPLALAAVIAGSPKRVARLLHATRDHDRSQLTWTVRRIELTDRDPRKAT
jgi:hypothetical protein